MKTIKEIFCCIMIIVCTMLLSIGLGKTIYPEDNKIEEHKIFVPDTVPSEAQQDKAIAPLPPYGALELTE